MAKSVLIVGAGKEGKGNLGEIFIESGWDVSFLDKDPKVVNELKKGSYTVVKYQVDKTVEQKVAGYDVYLADSEYACLSAVEKSDIIALCLYPEDIPEAAEYLAPLIAKRAADNGKKLSIISGTNKNHIIDKVKSDFRSFLGGVVAEKWFDDNVVVRDMIIIRSVDAESNYALSLVASVVSPQFIQQPLNVDVSDVRWLKLKDNLEQLKDIKVYTVNAPHATCAYAGYLKGYKTINEASSDPEIAKLMNAVLEEAVSGLSGEFGVPEKEIWDFCNIPKPHTEMIDTIFRVAKDPLRKLSNNDRLTGNALFCLKHGINPSALICSIANGMAYDEKDDPSAVELQGYIRDLGIEKAVAKVCGLPQDHEIVRRVSEQCRKI
jgi:mannitol-1-phosphate 5-dehydrogenase